MPDAAEPLAPLQQIMLGDSMAGGDPGAHVEQVEIVFSGEIGRERLTAAWAMTVAAAEVLQMTFVFDENEPTGWEKADHVASLEWQASAQGLLENLLTKDRLRPLLAPGSTPWRVACHPHDRRFIWTFHHALLDGRSITKILRGFFQCLRDGTAPEAAKVTKWIPADAEAKARAAAFFQQEFAGLKITEDVPGFSVPPKAIRCLGKEAAARLESSARAIDVSPATFLIWSWGQAVMKSSRAAAAVVEQVRCGPPQPGRIGFAMNTLPLAIRRATSEPLETQLRKFRAHLLAMRDFESVAPQELPPEVTELTNGPWSSVIMIERGNLTHLTGAGPLVESIVLHEWAGASLTAAAYHFPDLRLEVEGPRNAELLDRWAKSLLALLG